MLRKLSALRLPPRLSFLRSAPVRYALHALLLCFCAGLLNVWMNARFPIPTDVSDHLLLAVEVPVAFALVGLTRRLGLRLPLWSFVIVGILALLVRLFMAADNISHRYLYRDFRVPLDLHLVPEFFRLMYDTSPVRALVGYATLLILFSVFMLTTVELLRRRSERLRGLRK